MSGINRGRKILNMLSEAWSMPKHESTKGLNILEKNLALKKWRGLNSIDAKTCTSTSLEDKFLQKNNLFFKMEDFTTSNQEKNIINNKENNNSQLECNLVEKNDNKVNNVRLYKEQANDQMCFQEDVDILIGHKTVSQGVKRSLQFSLNTEDKLYESDPYETDSDEEYIPSSDTVDSDESISENEASISPVQNSVLHSSSQSSKSNSPQVSTDSRFVAIKRSISSMEYKNFKSDIDNKSKEIVKNKYVPNSTVVGTYTKIFFCIFCKKRVKRFAKHLITYHKTVEEVTKVLNYPAKSIKRQNLIASLRNAGTFMYNNNDELNKGDLIVSRRPNPKKNRRPDYYTPCKYCKAYFVTNNIYRHYKICTLNQTRNSKNAKLDSVALQMQMDYKKHNLHPNVPFLLQNLRDDEIAKVIKEDFLLLKLASFLCNKFCTEDHLKYHCRQKLRQLSRLLITIKNENPDISDLRDCIQPKNFEQVIKGVQTLCGLNFETGEYKNPSLANHLGIYLRECTKILYNICIIDENHARKQLVDDFQHLLTFEYGAAISKSARKTVEQSKWNKPKLLPLISDIKSFRDHLVTKAEFSLKKLFEEEFSYVEWRNLMEVTGALILIFNRKRPGESERILLENYKSKQRIEKDSEDYKTLTTLEKVLCDTFTRIEIQGKRSRRVPVLLRKIHIRYIDTFLQFRSVAGVSDKNKYLFGLEENKFIRLTDVLRRESAACNAKQPHLLRATFLRKQVATTSQLLELNDNEMQMLTDFMGHDLQIHKDYYRTPEITLQIAKLSKLLIAVDNGDVLKYKGKNFETMDISLNEGVEEDTEVYCDVSEELRTDPINAADLDTIETENVYASSLSTNDVNSYENEDSLNMLNIHHTRYTSHKITRNKANVTKHIDKPKKFVKRLTWKTPEKKSVRELFKTYLENFTLPPEKYVTEMKKYRPELSKRTAAQIKAWINNENNRRLREQSQVD